MKSSSYWDGIIADNKALAANGMPYRYGADGIAVCATCGMTYFRADRANYANSDCPHYDDFDEPVMFDRRKHRVRQKPNKNAAMQRLFRALREDLAAFREVSSIASGKNSIVNQRLRMLTALLRDLGEE